MIRTSAEVYQRQGPKVRLTIHMRIVQGNGDDTKHFNGIPPPYGRTIGTNKSMAGAIPMILGQ